jgi:hypothetical protein
LLRTTIGIPVVHRSLRTRIGILRVYILIIRRLIVYWLTITIWMLLIIAICPYMIHHNAK